MSPEQQLWRSVIWQAFEDAFTTSEFQRDGERRTLEQDRRLARRWFGTNDFREVCDLADVHPRTVMAEYERRLA